MSDAELRRRVEQLEQKLAEAERTIHTLAGGPSETVTRGLEPTPHEPTHGSAAARQMPVASERLLGAVFDGATDAMVIADDDGHCLDANPAACALFGLEKSALLGRSVVDFAGAGSDAGEVWQRLVRGDQLRGQFFFVRADGTRREVELSAVANVMTGRHLSILRDVSDREAAATAFAEVERRLQLVIAHAPIIVFATDREGIYTLHEGRGVEAVGLRPGQIVGQSLLARMQQAPGADALFRRALAGEEVTAPFDSANRSFDCTLVPLRDAHGEVTGVTGVAVDVTPRRIAESALRASEARFRAMIEHASDVVWLAGTDGRIVYASPSTERVLGYAPADVVGTSMIDLIAEADREWVGRETLALVHDPAMGRALEFRARHRDGTERWVEAVGSNLLGDPAVRALVSNFRDITERKSAEAALLESRQLLEDAQAVAHLGSWVSGPDTAAPITWSDECARIFGGETSRPPTVRAFFLMVHPEDRAMVIAASERALTEGLPCETEHRIVRPTGEVRWLHARAVMEGSVRWNGEAPIDSPSGARPYRALGVVQDITARREVELALQASEHRYRRIVENTSEGVWMYDAAGNTTFMNARMAQMLGCKPEQALHRPIYEFMDDAARVEARERVARRSAGVAERGDFRLMRTDGSDVWISLHADPLYDASGNFEGALALATDITDRRRAEEARNRLAAIVESSDDAILSTDLTGVITSWNRGAERLFQWSAEEMCGRPTAVLRPADLTDDERAIHARVLRGEIVAQYETRRLRKDGSVVEVALSVSRLCDAEGRTIGLSTIARDLSPRRAAEALLRRTEDQLRQSQKMEAIGVLAGGVAHDFNNLLSVILSYSTLTVEALKPGDPLRADLEEISKAGMRATELTRQLLAFGRRQLLQPVVLDINQAVSGIERMLGRLLGEDVELVFSLAPSAGKIHADPGQLEQVIMNLVVNARDAMPRGGSLTIETADVDIDAEYAAEHPGVAPGRYVMVAVTDTGTGMDRATQEHIFEPFFTTKELGKGTGLGLSTAYGIVQQSGGHIWVYSELGRGTTFKVYFPSTDRTSVTQYPRAESVVTLRGTETILVTEDEPAVRTIVCSVLRRHGYQVLEAQNGGDALLVCEQFGATIHLLLTDVVMPRMSGPELAERLVKVRPAMRVLYVSGYTQDAIVHHGVVDSGIAFLSKPIMPEALLRKVREVLDARSASVTSPR